MIGARGLAARVLERVFEDEAFASAALDAEIRRHPGVDPRDVGLATELVYGVLRTEGFLESELDRLSTKKRATSRGRVRAELLIAVYSILFLDRIPAFAAVSEAVSGVKAAGGDRVAAFANAILRRLAGEIESSKTKPKLEDAALASAPGWLRGALRRSLGRAEATAFLGAGHVPPPIGLALALEEDRDAWIDRLRAAAPSASIDAGAVSPRAILVRGAGDVRKLPGFGDAWIVQEEGAQVIALATGARADDVVLDACAGRGNKAFLIGKAARAIDAVDLYPAKIAELEASPAGASVRAAVAIDWTVGNGGLEAVYDRVLVDAPCSGTGTLRRRPEIARGREPNDLARLADLQVAIASRASTLAKPKGRVIYAVCSVLREECEDVVARLQGLEPAPFDDALANRLADGGTSFRLLPHVHGTDGYFVASFVRR